jgi:hypothetical protein
MKRFATCFTGFVIILIILSVAGGLFSSCVPFAKWHSRLKGDVDQEYIVQDARNRILSYDWYYDQYAQIEAQRANIEMMDRDASELDGMVRVVNSMIGEYNAKSRQYNHNMWKAPDLPYQIDYIKEY